ncbi:MAG: hypothetical protein ACK4K7_01675 [Allosphingosinicella sp.]|uniref:hypothetical protein n=1 Tax=Allosphingosinicella sp. TaxID=2823234 RepID=UPI003958B352
MGPALYVIAILGCGEGTATCEQLRVADQRYESRAECVAQTEAQLLRFGDEAPYPVIVAECRAADAPPRLLTADEVDLPEPEAQHPFRPAAVTRIASRD